MRPTVDQRTVTVGATPTQVLGPSPRRKGIVVSAPPGSAVPGVAGSVLASNLDTSAGGTLLSFTVPAGTTALLTGASFFLVGGTAPTVSLQFVRGVAVATIWSGSVSTQIVTNIPLQAGDIVRWRLIAGGAGSSGDFLIGVSADPEAGRVTLSFLQNAVLDKGINLYPGDPPLVLTDEDIGAAFEEGLNAIGAQAGNQLTIWDIGGG